MSMILAALLKPLIALTVFAPAMALGLWLTRKLPDGKIKSILLFDLHGRNSRRAVHRPN